MARTSYNGYLRQYGGPTKRNNTPAVMMASLRFTFAADQARNTPTGKFLPVGSIPMGVQTLSGDATGTTPQIDIGLVGGGNAALALNLTADGHTGLTHTGTALGIELTANTEIGAGEGASTPTGGTTTVSVYYIMADDGSEGA